MFKVEDYRSKTFLIRFNKPLIFVVTEFLIDCSFALMQKNQKTRLAAGQVKTVRKNLEIQRCTSLKFLNSSRLAGTQTRLAALPAAGRRTGKKNF